MNFLAILICLTIERFTAVGKKTREFHLIEHYLRWSQSFLAKFKLNRYLKLLAILIPIALVVGVVFWALSLFYYGVYSFVFVVIVLFYCLGTFDISYEHGHGHALKMANQNIFAVLFWFVVFAQWGLIAAIVYRMVDFTAKHADDDQLASLAFKAQQYLDWIPSRLFALGAGLVSHFMAIMPYWLKHVLSGAEGSDILLDECGHIAIEADTSMVERSEKIKQLIDRVLVFWLVVIALLILIR